MKSITLISVTILNAIREGIAPQLNAFVLVNIKLHETFSLLSVVSMFTHLVEDPRFSLCLLSFVNFTVCLLVANNK